MVDMPLLSRIGGLCLSTLAETRLGTLGVVLLLLIGAAVQLRRSGLAVGAAVVFTWLMIQA
ncbi:hypothetical protein GCM10009535_40660 [Streptomyces thermocarboxydovorans]|uniref:Uncharacterized protein n=1 Tax=Streptomyces thermocarboxydovorans TaxID=59298 RepID=A0ABP3SPK8_9ACTN